MANGGNWWDPYLAPGIVVGVIIAAFSWVRSYLSGKKSNIREAKQLEDTRAERAETKDIKEKADAKLLELEKTTAATVLKKDAKEEAIEVKKDTNERMDTKFKFSDQEHASKHAELTNEIRALRTLTEQLSKDFEEFKRDTSNEIDQLKRPLKY